MDKILSNVAFGGFNETPAPVVKDKVAGGKSGDKKKKKKKKKKKRKKEQAALTNSKVRDANKSDGSSSDSDSDIDVGDSSTVDMFGIQARQKLVPGVAASARLPDLQSNADAVAAIRKGRGRPKKGLQASLQEGSGKRGPKPKYYSPDAVAKVGGVVAGTARPSFDTDSDSNSDSEHERRSNGRKRSKAEKTPSNLVDLPSNSDTMGSSDLETDFSAEEEPVVQITSPTKVANARVVKGSTGVKASGRATTAPTQKQPALKLKIKLPPAPDKKKEVKKTKVSKRRRSSGVGSGEGGSSEGKGGPISKKMRESLALNMSARVALSSGSEEENVEQQQQIQQQPLLPALPGPKLFCYCQCPHDEVTP